MVTSDPMTLSTSGFVRRIRSSFWTSRLSAALGEQFADHAKVLISGVGFWHTAIRAVRFSGQPLPTTLPMRCSTYFAVLSHSIGSSRTQPMHCEMSGGRVNQDLRSDDSPFNDYFLSVSFVRLNFGITSVLPAGIQKPGNVVEWCLGRFR